ncbi:hypothetical protein LMH87_011618 [Akanthomyces muscarius]|uniref:Uncharacterized protein n=1 Tax=Akanthomyces muscarius TaxID=2231603 RepID=A0A9W8ULA9_AKAMU|nr:hypothetical protein LMH87_011618 [Akanthomyces muscarius]KAJ4150890.1 hypothetical protein LMH87_011618 [Akanthomyces muscarius]
MTPTPPSTNSSTGARSPEDSYKVVRKRNRVPLSCYPCRTRKCVLPLHLVLILRHANLSQIEMRSETSLQ